MLAASASSVQHYMLRIIKKSYLEGCYAKYG